MDVIAVDNHKIKDQVAQIAKMTKSWLLTWRRTSEYLYSCLLRSTNPQDVHGQEDITLVLNNRSENNLTPNITMAIITCASLRDSCLSSESLLELYREAQMKCKDEYTVSRLLDMVIKRASQED